MTLWRSLSPFSFFELTSQTSETHYILVFLTHQPGMAAFPARVIKRSDKGSFPPAGCRSGQLSEHARLNIAGLRNSPGGPSLEIEGIEISCV